MNPLKLRFWMDGDGKLSRLKACAEQWWAQVQDWLFILPPSIDPLTAQLDVVDKLACACD